jgi:hypothetical protein
MLLSKDENRELFTNYFPLLFYAAVYEGLMPETSVLSDMIDTPVEVKVNARNALFSDKEILDNFKRDNKHTLTKERVAFIKNVQSGILSDFIVLKETKKFAVLQDADNGKFYHVHALTESFSEMLAYTPTYVTTAIFNFNGRIVCDGLITGTNIQLGKNIEQRITEEYNDCKRNKTVEELIK